MSNHVVPGPVAGAAGIPSTNGERAGVARMSWALATSMLIAGVISTRTNKSELPYSQALPSPASVCAPCTACGYWSSHRGDLAAKPAPLGLSNRPLPASDDE